MNTPRIETLRKEITRLNDLYYNSGISDVEDAVYDSLKRELMELEGETDDPRSPINQVGAPSDGTFRKVRHLTPMLSLSNAYNEQDLTDWAASLRGIPDIALEFKYDGASLNLIYIDGVLKHAVTRGDGEVGDDITDNAVHIEGIPTKLANGTKGAIEIRGECIVTHANFQDALRLAERDGRRVYANPRNMVAGLIRSKDSDKLLGYGISFIAYDAIVQGDKGPEHVPLELLNEGITENFNLSPTLWEGNTASMDELIRQIETMARDRSETGFDIDGAVIKIVNPAIRKEVGNRSTSPRWAIAYKFEAQSGTSVLESVDVQVGRTGVLTPVAKIRPVRICGVTITSVTLHNFDEIERLDLRIGDTVTVSRRGDVIPKIEGVVKALRVDEHGRITPPGECPSCSGKVTKVGSTGSAQVHRLCLNVHCPDQVLGRFVHYTSRAGVDIKYFGPSAIEALLAIDALPNFSSIYKLTEDDFYRAGIGATMTDKILASIQRSRRLPFYKVLRAVNIPEVGDSTARSIAEHYGDFKSLLASETADVVKIDGVGSTVAFSITARRIAEDVEPDLLLLDDILEYEAPVENNVRQDLEGMTFVVTGSKFGESSRQEHEDELKSRGAKVSGSVSKNTTAVHIGTNPGAKKLEDAERLGVQVIKVI